MGGWGSLFNAFHMPGSVIHLGVCGEEADIGLALRGLTVGYTHVTLSDELRKVPGREDQV